MESVRWLKANAGTYGIDTTRIVALGGSAGAATVFGVAVADDPTPGGPLASYSPTVTAVAGSGGHLTPGLGVLDFAPTDAAMQVFFFEQDTAAGQVTWDYAYQTCTAMRAGGGTCDFVLQPGTGHGVPLHATGPWWPVEVGPFVWHHLDLAGLD